MPLFTFVPDMIWYIASAGLLIALALLAVGAFTLSLGLFVKGHCDPKIAGKQIALTFDDGPSPCTTAVLDALKKHKAKATFFCIGSQIEKHPEIFNRIICEGHATGNHSYSHSVLFPFFSRKQILQELTDTDALMSKYTVHEPKMFRPPFGVTNPNIAQALKRSGHKVMGWNLRSFDTVSRNPNRLLRRLKSKIKPGSVILLHDTLSPCADIVEGILHFAKEQNLDCVTITKIFRLDV